MKKRIISIVMVMFLALGLTACGCSNNEQKTGQITDTTVDSKNYQNSQSNSSYGANNSSSSNSSNGSSSYNSNSSSNSGTNKSSSIVGTWKVSTFGYPDDWTVDNVSHQLSYIGDGWVDESSYWYHYVHPALVLKFKQDGTVYTTTPMGDNYIGKYENKNDGSIVASITNGTTRMDIATFKYNQNDNTLTIETFTGDDGNVVTEDILNGYKKITDRSTAIGTVYKKTQ